MFFVGFRMILLFYEGKACKLKFRFGVSMFFTNHRFVAAPLLPATKCAQCGHYCTYRVNTCRSEAIPQQIIIRRCVTVHLLIRVPLNRVLRRPCRRQHRRARLTTISSYIHSCGCCRSNRRGCGGGFSSGRGSLLLTRLYTDNWAGRDCSFGQGWVGDRGPEVVSLPNYVRQFVLTVCRGFLLRVDEHIV